MTKTDYMCQETKEEENLPVLKTVWMHQSESWEDLLSLWVLWKITNFYWCEKLSKIWIMIMILSDFVGNLGTIPKNLGKSLREQEIWGKPGAFRYSVLLTSSRILNSVLQIWNIKHLRKFWKILHLKILGSPICNLRRFDDSECQLQSL